MTKLLCTTPGPESRPPDPHTEKAVKHLLRAKVETVRALSLYPKESTHPLTRHRLQQVAGAISLLIGVVEPMVASEPPEPTSTRSEVTA